MTRLTSIIGALDELLTPAEFSDLAPNGLQVPGPEEVTRIVTGVSAQRGSSCAPSPRARSSS